MSAKTVERFRQTIECLQKLVADLSGALSDEGDDWSESGLDNMRRRVANAVPLHLLPYWMQRFRDAPVIPSEESGP